MLQSGHYGAALLAYAPVGLLLSSVDPTLAVFGGVGSLVMSRLPDWDRQVAVVEHRGVTHSVPFLVVTVAAFGWLCRASSGALGVGPLFAGGVGAAVAFLAVGSHLLADALTPFGVPLLWPASNRRFSAGLVTADDPTANYGLLAIGVGSTVAVCYLAL